ncbi:SCO2322 family protein [Actinoallomurus purpureus]|uniref:SCO2322 family protein n=1 Tax=Actinoallomurus purpureus TaxID=478114 RepID=UPI0020931331|nr:SCO2322 family protein [Actinoallomurus purpureus]MCO6005661.1 SCO2322 family protein [Actinoallomurus purpureus]
MPKIAAGLLVSALLLAPMPEAHADAVAFWGYWQAKGDTWAFATTGPAQAHPKDGAVEGWRFAKSSGTTGTPPRDKPDFAAICGSASAPAGKKRVALVVDYGDAADAPKDQRPPSAGRSCAIVPESATGTDVLATAGVKVQTDKSGLICAIDAFGPCGAPGRITLTATASPAAAGKKDKDSGTPVGLYAGIGLVVLIAAGGGVLALRRSRR